LVLVINKKKSSFKIQKPESLQGLKEVSRSLVEKAGLPSDLPFRLYFLDNEEKEQTIENIFHF